MQAFNPARLLGVLALALGLAVSAAPAAAPPGGEQAGAVSLAVVPAVMPASTPSPLVEIIPAGCSSCNSGLLGGVLGPPPLPGPEGQPDCPCNGAGCVPGRKPCHPCEGKTILGRFLCGLYECICCPDPCYEGRFLPLADAAFFVEAVRPVTQQKIRWDSGHRVILMDRSEFFWARADGRGSGPRVGGGSGVPSVPGVSTPSTGQAPSGPPFTDLSLRYNDFVLVTEGGNGMISLIVETPYRNLQTELGLHSSGYTDMTIATKTLLFDCELLQIAFMFKTFMPTGSASKGLGVGHLSLEPSLLMGVKLAPTCYFQMQLSEWIPLGGEPSYAGSVFHYHFSVNKEVCRCLPDVPLIWTCELNGWSFQDGLYTDPFLGPGQKASGTTYLTAGCGLRLFVCDRIDIGLGAAFALTREHFARDLYRTEFRLRY